MPNLSHAHVFLHAFMHVQVHMHSQHTHARKHTHAHAHAHTYAHGQTHTRTRADPDALGLPISPAGQTILSFWLVNAEPEPMTGGSDAQGGAATGRGFATWDFKAFEAAYLQPILSALAPVVELSVVSQVGGERGPWGAAT